MVADVDHRAHDECARARGGYRAWIRAARIRQWPKNLLVFTAPAAAGISGTPTTVTPLLITFLVFCLLATGTYLVNDVQDADEDRRHPVKCHRPIASGALEPGRALVAAGISLVFALMVAITVNWATFASACAYVLLNVAYTLCLRRITVVEMVAISGAFVLRRSREPQRPAFRPREPSSRSSRWVLCSSRRESATPTSSIHPLVAHERS